MVRNIFRRIAQRILETSLALFNRFGEPNISTTLISSELNISPGTPCHHYPAKAEIINRPFHSFDASLRELLGAAPGVGDAEGAWFFVHALSSVLRSAALCTARSTTCRRVTISGRRSFRTS